jgi:hypothetical protein
MFYNRDVTQMFPGIIEQQFCRIRIDNQNKIYYDPICEYWDLETDSTNKSHYVLNNRALNFGNLDTMTCQISMDMDGNILYDYKRKPKYWILEENRENKINFVLNDTSGDPFIVEQFCKVIKDRSGKIKYKPNLDYWTKVNNKGGVDNFVLNEKAKSFLKQGARKIENGDLLRSPAIASFFPLFGHIPDSMQAHQLAQQVVNPWMWWPVDGIPIPTQPMMIQDSNGNYIPNKVYEPDRYWRGPTWMASEKPVIDGFKSYGYEMIYLYLVHRTVRTLQDGRAVEHWNPETGSVNTSNINFPWS